MLVFCHRMLAMTEAAGCTVTLSGFEFALVPAAVVSAAVNAYALASKSAVVKLQTKELLAVVVLRVHAAIPHRHRGAGRRGSRQGHGIVGIDHAIGDSWSRGGRRRRSGCGWHRDIEAGSKLALVPRRRGRIGGGECVCASKQVRGREAPDKRSCSRSWS